MALERRSQLGEKAFSAEEQQHIRKAIRRKYQEVSRSAEGFFRYPTGKKGAIDLGYDPVILNAFPDDALNSFCGVGNPFSISPIPAGSTVLDIGCGAGFDLLVASTIVGDKGRVCGIDLTEEMIKKARLFVERFGGDHSSVQHVSAEEIPYTDESFDYVISNGVFNLSPSKLELFKETRRVLKPNGILQFADVSLVDGKTPDQASSPEDWAQ
jgi:arsenite methyltransferase